MKEKVEEVVNYFKTKIKTLDCVINEVTHRDYGWTVFDVTIDEEYIYRFSVCGNRLFVIHSGTVNFDMNEEELSFIGHFIEKHKNKQA